MLKVRNSKRGKKKPRQTDEEINEELTKLMLYGIEGFENKELDEKAEHKRYWENGVVIVSEYDEMLKNERNNIIRIGY